MRLTFVLPFLIMCYIMLYEMPQDWMFFVFILSLPFAFMGVIVGD